VLVLIANIEYGWDRHIWDMRPDKFIPCIQIALAMGILFALTSLLTKLSLYTFYLRLLGTDGSRVYRRTIWFMEFLCVMLVVVYTLQVLLLCR
jgi:hypothetical protein